MLSSLMNNELMVDVFAIFWRDIYDEKAICYFVYTGIVECAIIWRGLLAYLQHTLAGIAIGRDSFD